MRPITNVGPTAECYLGCGNDFLSCSNDLLTCGNDFLSCQNDLLTCGNDFLSCGNDLLSCGNKIKKSMENSFMSLPGLRRILLQVHLFCGVLAQSVFLPHDVRFLFTTGLWG